MPDSLEDKNNNLLDAKKASLNKKPKSVEPKPGEPGGAGGKWKAKNLILLAAMVAASFLLVQMLDSQNKVEEKTYSEFRRLIADTAYPITAVQMLRVGEGYALTGERRATPAELAAQRELKGGAEARTTRFKTMLPDVDAQVNEVIQQLEARGIPVDFKRETRWFTYLSTFLPLILIILFFWFMSARQSSQMGGPRGIFGFGKVKPRVSDDNKPKVTFKDVSGADEAKQELHEIIDFLRDPAKFNRLGGRIPKGVLLLGPPGTGKTLLAKAVAGEAEVPFFSMSGSDFVEMFVGVGASRVRDLFEQSKKNAPCIIFIDEIDAVGRQRGAGLGGGHDEREQTLNQLLVEMDGFSANDGVILIAATNRPDVLDPALLRPGRFDRQVVVDLPDAKGREGILNVHLNKRKVPLASDIDVARIAKGTPGLSGADLENLVNEACLLAARFGSEKVSMIDFEEAKDKVMIGTERPSRIIGEEEKRTTAYHEAGHAIVSLNVKYADPLHKITIIPRGRALGITFQLPEKDTYTVDSRFVLDKIAILMGGRGAELLMFDQMNTGASNDIERATELARKYVCEWGMSEMGPISYGKKQEEIFLGREISQHRDYSEATAVEIDRVVRGIVQDQMKRVIALLTEHRQDLVNLAEAVLEHETLEADEVALAIKGELTGSSRKTRNFVKSRAALNLPSQPLPPEAVLRESSANAGAAEPSDLPPSSAA
ncbi:MAG: ATP-dependent metalloprotease FtsH [Fibrobacteria bacterium]|jgi:cell division protease FtsH|nr:ATP-dependent metalloprotease FtsH [Fibrobacteria bacterium]